MSKRKSHYQDFELWQQRRRREFRKLFPGVNTTKQHTLHWGYGRPRNKEPIVGCNCRHCCKLRGWSDKQRTEAMDQQESFNAACNDEYFNGLPVKDDPKLWAPWPEAV